MTMTTKKYSSTIKKKGKTYSNSIINIKNQAIADAGATKTFVLTGTPVNNVQ